MVHIIFIILKIIGVLLLIVLGLLLLAVLSVLFVPVCYRLEGVKNPSELFGSARISWLGGLISARITVSKDGTAYIIRIFGISVERLKRILTRLGTLFHRKTRKPEKLEKSKKPEGSKSPESRDTSENPETPDISYTQSGGEKEDAGDNNAGNSKEDRRTGIFAKIRLVWLQICGIPSKICRIFQKIKLTIADMYDKIKKWKSFLADENTKEVIRFLWSTSKSMLRHLAPRRAKGYVKFGFEDPALTGQALGMCSVFIPLHKTKLNVIPVFDQGILEGRVTLSGHILGVILLRLAWRVYRNRSVKKIIRRFQHKEA